jgi:hypothetical protein
MSRSNIDHNGHEMFGFQPRRGHRCLSTVSVFFVTCRVIETLEGGGDSDLKQSRCNTPSLMKNKRKKDTTVKIGAQRVLVM